MADNYQSKEVRALRTINSAKYPDTNKDLEKNIRRLNSNVDYISSYMITMQKGIDDAGKNFIEQIQSFINDIIVLFAGGEPTGIDVGDLKYIFQAIGALFGFGSSPFPINLLEAAQHFLFGYVVPLEAFTDLLYNTIEAWLIEAGMPQSLIDAVKGFFDAINDLGDEFGDLFAALGGIFNIFGISNDTGPFGALWAAIEDLFSGIILPSLKPILEVIAMWTTPFVEALGYVVQQIANFIDFLGDTINWASEDGIDIGAALSSFFVRLGELITIDFSGPVEFIQSLIENLFDGFGGVVDFVGDIISSIFGFTGFDLTQANSMFNQLGDIFNNIIVTPITSAIGNIANWFQSLLGWQSTTESTQLNLQNFQISTISAGARNPTWVCRYPRGDVTYAECLNMRIAIFGDTDSASTGTAHTHELNNVNTAWAESPGYSITQNNARFGWITISETTIMDTMGVILWKDSGTLNNVYLELFRQSEDGSMSRVSSTEISSSIGTTADYIEVDLSGIIVQGAEKYAIKIRNSSSVATTVWVMSIRQQAGGADAAGSTTGSTDTNKTSYTSGEVTSILAASQILPWGLIAAKNLAETDQSFSDDFNRSAIGGLWSLKSNTGSNQLIISGNRARFSGSTDGIQMGLYVRKTASDSMRVDGTLHDVAAATSGARAGLMINCNRDMSQIVYLSTSNSNLKIYSGPWDSLTERASIGTTGSGSLSIYYDVVLNKYVALKDDEPTGLEWTDTGNLMQHGADYQYGGIRQARSIFFNSATIDNFTLRDWTP